MRTNVVLNDDLVTEAMQYTSARSKRALIEEALQTFVDVKAEERRRRTYGERVRSLQNRLATVKTRSSAIDVVREDRGRQ
jgi:Arc/MetJ family transcription regulator